MKLYLLLACLVAASLAAPSAEQLKADALHNLEKQLMQPQRSHQSSLTPEERLLDDIRTQQLTPLQQLMLLKEEKMLALQKEEDMLNFKRDHLIPLEESKFEKSLELEKEKMLLDFKRSYLSALEKLAQVKEETLLPLKKEEDLLEHKASLGYPQSLEELLNPKKDEKIPHNKRNNPTPLQDLLEGKLGLKEKELMLLKDEKMLPLKKDEELLKLKLTLLDQFPTLTLLSLCLDKIEQTIMDGVNSDMRQMNVNDILVMHRQMEMANESLRRIKFMLLLQALNIEMAPMPNSEMLPGELLVHMLKKNKEQQEMEFQRKVDELLVGYRSGKASLAMTLAEYKRAEIMSDSRPVLNILDKRAEKKVHDDVFDRLKVNSTSDNETLSFLGDIELLRLIQNEQLSELFNLFKLQFKRQYLPEEEAFRKKIFEERVKLITFHNIEAKLGKHSFLLGINNLTDWMEDELEKLRGNKVPTTAAGEPGHRVKRQAPYMPTYSNTVNVSTLPATVNWTAEGWVGPVLNQGSCGCCWAFAAAGALEAQYFNKTKTYVQMSEQNLIDCTSTTTYGNSGCDGGAFQYAWNYVMDVGIDSYASYPYTDSNGTCKYSAANSVTTDNGWWNIEQDSELALQQAVAQVGPVAVGIDASPLSFQYYRSGVYADTACTSLNIDHAVVVVGYGTTSAGQDYWLIQNSWGTSWGIDGYMMMARNDGNMCGIASDAGMPVIN